MKQIEANRLATRGAPNFGMTEAKALQMLQQIENLTASNNQLVAELDALRKFAVVDTMMELKVMVQAAMELLGRHGLLKHGEFETEVHRQQYIAMGLDVKDDGGERGDTLVIRFRVLDGERVVEDKTGEIVMYPLGSERLGCDRELVGIKAGETRSVTTVFGPNYPHKDVVGREVVLEVKCETVLKPAQKAG